MIEDGGGDADGVVAVGEALAAAGAREVGVVDGDGAGVGADAGGRDADREDAGGWVVDKGLARARG